VQMWKCENGTFGKIAHFHISTFAHLHIRRRRHFPISTFAHLHTCLPAGRFAHF
jgi:hypothetical protein